MTKPIYHTAYRCKYHIVIVAKYRRIFERFANMKYKFGKNK